MNITNCSIAQDKNREADINSIFDKMELQGVDTKKPLLYGYFFYDKEKSKLDRVKEELVQANYKVIRFEMTEKQEYILHVEKIETHSRISLLERENQLDKLAKKYEVTYDGWDVGNADPTKPLVSTDTFAKSLDNKTDKELYKIASTLYDNDSNDKAVIAFEKCIERNYKKDTCYYKQGVSYIGLGQSKLGIAKLEEALKINPKYFKACFNIGAASYDNDDYQKSIEYYQKALKLEPKDDRVLYGIAASQFVLGQINEAETNCKAALKFNPSNDNAKTLLTALQNKK
jgi:tetratricopeptide (TPR) repeat protein